jgi:hypothetical protein
MAAKHKVTVSVQPANHRATSAERRAAQLASLSGRQAELKQEAADRRAKRESESTPPPPPPRKVGSAHRSAAR